MICTEVVKLVLFKVGEVEYLADEVNLLTVVTFIIIIVNDILLPILDICGNILEVVEVLRISEYIIRVSSLNVAIVATFAVFDSLILFSSHPCESKVLLGVLLFLKSPLFVLFIKSFVVKWNLFLLIILIDSQAAFQYPLKWSSNALESEEEEEHNVDRPGWSHCEGLLHHVE